MRRPIDWAQLTTLSGRLREVSLGQHGLEQRCEFAAHQSQSKGSTRVMSSFLKEPTCAQHTRLSHNTNNTLYLYIC